MVGGAGPLRRDQKGCWDTKRLRNAVLDEHSRSRPKFNACESCASSTARALLHNRVQNTGLRVWSVLVSTHIVTAYFNTTVGQTTEMRPKRLSKKNKQKTVRAITANALTDTNRDSSYLTISSCKTTTANNWNQDSTPAKQFLTYYDLLWKCSQF